MVLTIPLPLLLTSLFKKRIVLVRQDEEHKILTLRLWILKERVGWVLLVVVHVWCIFFMLQFVRYYPIVIAELWFSGSVWSLVHRFLSAPSLRVLLASGMLHASKHTWLCDFCLVMDQSVTQFAVLPGADAAKNHWQSAMKG